MASSPKLPNRKRYSGLSKFLKGGFDDDLLEATQIRLEDRDFMTVENYTAWMRMDRPETAMFYLGGYTTRKQRDFF